MAEALKSSWAAAASGPKAELPLRSVQLDGLAVLKIVKHCTECQPSLVTGQLLGLDIGTSLEVTNCFPFPSRAAEEGEDDESEGANYQLEMMRCLREVNVDNNTVGWYQSTYMGSYQTVELIETFLNYQDHIKRCVCIIYDPVRSTQGTIALKALRLTDAFMDTYRNTDFTSAQIAERALPWNDIFQEIPVTVTSSALAGAVLGLTAGPGTLAGQADFDQLGLSTNPFLEKNLEFLNECMDDLAAEGQKVAYHSRAVARQQSQQAAWVQKRRAENAQRRAQGQEVLPEEEPGNPLFKPLPEPSRLDGFLIVNQVANYCAQVDQFGTKSVQKLYLAECLQGGSS